MATHEAQQKTNEAAEMAKQKLEIGAKELQEKLGGAENHAVVTSQIVIPSEAGKKAQEVTLLHYPSRMFSARPFGSAGCNNIVTVVLLHIALKDLSLDYHMQELCDAARLRGSAIVVDLVPF
jgi:hypothetical protein